MKIILLRVGVEDTSGKKCILRDLDSEVEKR